MSKKVKDALKQLDEKQLKEEIEKFRRELFKLKLAVVSSPAKDTTQFAKLRKDIARAVTYLRQKQQEKAKLRG